MDDQNLADTVPTPAHTLTGTSASNSQPAGDIDLTRPVHINAASETTRPIQRANDEQPSMNKGESLQPAGTGNENLTQPLDPSSDLHAGQGAPVPPAVHSGPSPWIFIVLLAIATLLIIAGMSAFGGYNSGLALRRSAQSTQIAGQVQEQYLLGVEDITSGRYEIARQRFEWVIQQDPFFPGAIDRLAEVQMMMGITATPTQAPTPTLTPTPDTRTRDELFLGAQQALGAAQWTTAIDTLLKLRKDAPDYNPVQVDGWLYIALRYRGVEKIKNADLEGGTYDLALASRFGPLDSEATNYKSWAELYITGASYWDVDWFQATNAFSQLIVIAPYLRDGSGWTSIDRYRLSLIKYGDWLALQGRWCEAQEQYQISLNSAPNPTVEPTATYAAEQCASPSQPETPLLETPTPTLSLGTPIDGGVLDPTSTPTPDGVENPGSPYPPSSP